MDAVFDAVLGFIIIVFMIVWALNSTADPCYKCCDDDEGAWLS